MWDDSKFLAFDFETSGELPEYALQPWRVPQNKAWVTSLAWVYKDQQDIRIRGKLHPTVDDMREMLQYAIDNNITIVGWNVAFDISWLFAYGLGDMVMQVKWLDGMLLWRHYFIEPEYDTAKDKKKPYGLKECVVQELPQFAGYEEDVDFHSTDPADLKKLHEYNIRDTLFTLRLTKRWYTKLAENLRRLKAALIEAEALPLVARANFEGMLVDTLAAHELQAHLTNVANKALNDLSEHGVTKAVVRSPIRLSKVMYDNWGLKVLKENTSKKTGKVSRSTDKEVLHELSFHDPRVAVLRLFREALGNKTKFADKPLQSVDYNGDGCTHPVAMIFGTYTGRVTYASKQGKNKAERQTGFALHQEKRSKEFRAILIPPSGYTLMEFDAAGQEFRWMAIASGDETMLGLCAPGEDPHSYMGARIAGVDYKEMLAKVHVEDKQAKSDRQLGKVANLSLQYRTSARKLLSVARVQYNIPMEPEQAQLIHATYQKTYTRVPKYWNEQISNTKRLGYVETLAGRRVQVRGNWAGPLGWSMGSTAINYRIQGTGADQKYLALAVMKPYLIKIGARFAWELHDGIYLYVPDAYVSQAAVEIKALLDNLPYRKAWGITPPIPLPWDCKVGKSWGSLKEYVYG